MTCTIWLLKLNNFINKHFLSSHFRTKWKRQTAVGLELLAEAGNYAAFQRLYGGPPYLGAWPYPSQGGPGAPPSAADLYYRQAAAAALQKPLPYRLYPGVPTLGTLGTIPGPSTPFSHLSASSSLSSLSSYYQNNNNNNNTTTPPGQMRQTPSPPLNPGSPEAKSDPPSDDEDTIQVWKFLILNLEILIILYLKNNIVDVHFIKFNLNTHILK